VVDLGFRGVDADNPDKEIIHRGRYKSLSPQQKGWLRRRQAVEPAIGHLKSDNRMDRCWLQGALGDALHSISCAAGYNLRWLMRAIARLGLGPAFLRLLQAALSLASAIPAPHSAQNDAGLRLNTYVSRATTA
jgi:IS5 family transposase